MASRHSPDARHDWQSCQFLRTLSIGAALLVLAARIEAQPQDPSAAEPSAADPPAAGPPAPGGEVAPSDPAPLLRQAREKLATYRTLKAKLSETVSFGPRRFKAEGEYLQGAGNRVRIDLAISIGENKGRLLQVSEGDVLWTVYELNSKKRVTRRDVNQILAAAKDDAAKATQLAELGLGGLPALLASIEGSIAFKAPLAANVDGRDFHVLEGEWTPEIRQQFQQQLRQARPGSPASEELALPPHIPDLVRIYLDAETSFPYRIRYLKRASAAGTEPSPILTLDFRDIVVNASLDPSEFYAPATDGSEVADITPLYLQQLRTAGGQPTPGSPAPSPAPGGSPPPQ